jgi:hypothetical protein
VIIAKSLFTVRGTWTSSTDYRILTISINGGPQELSFLNRAWQLNSEKAPPVKFANNNGRIYSAIDFKN